MEDSNIDCGYAARILKLECCFYPIVWTEISLNFLWPKKAKGNWAHLADFTRRMKSLDRLAQHGSADWRIGSRCGLAANGGTDEQSVRCRLQE